jgi:hypothetical protein
MTLTNLQKAWAEVNKLKRLKNNQNAEYRNAGFIRKLHLKGQIKRSEANIAKAKARVKNLYNRIPTNPYGRLSKGLPGAVGL